MTYYFISGAPEKIRNFLNRFPMLSDATPLKAPDQLKSIPENAEVFIFVDLQSLPVEIQGIILSVRKKLPLAKLIYVTGDKNAHDLKAHQMSPIGGDAYVPFEALASELNDIVEALTETRPPKTDSEKNRLESKSNDEFADLEGLLTMKNHPLGQQIDEIFKTVIKAGAKRPVWQSAAVLVSPEENTDVGESMSTKDQELSFDDGELEISIGDENESASLEADEGLDLSLDVGEELSLSEGEDELDLNEASPEDDAQFGDLNLDDSEDLALNKEEQLEDLGELDFSEVPENDELNLSENTLTPALDLSDEETPAMSLEQSQIMDEDALSLSDAEMSDDAMAKLKEIDAIMDFDASQVAIRPNPLQEDAAVDEPLVSDDLNLDSISFTNDEVVEEEEERPKKRKKETKESRDFGQDLKEISGAYSGEMERMQATISNLRSDREELLAKIQKLEEDKVLQGRGTLSLRAELDEKKIELTIIRKKLNEEISDLKDRLKLFDEKRLIMEEKNRILAQELDKAAQKNKIDVKKVQMRERELEQKLELLKSDAETQIRNRDLKILELKRKIDAMEFDMESISMQEKRSVESRFELEDKLEKAIKTLRSAITVLEDETDRTNALDALKKNIDV